MKGTMVRSLNVLIPTHARPSAVAVTLASLSAQSYTDFDVILSDQTGYETDDPLQNREVLSAIRVLKLHGNQVFLHKHLPRRGIAGHRQFLLEQSNSSYVLYLDDDLILEPDVISRMMKAMGEEQCGFVGCAPIGLSYFEEERPHQQAIEFWDGPVQPERVDPASPLWQRHLVHNAANILHVQQRLGITPDRQRKYRVAWVGACVLYDARKLEDAGAFRSWQDLPAHTCGEDVLAQTRVLERYGGCGIIPSGVYHQEHPAEIPDRSVNALAFSHTRQAGPDIAVQIPAGELVDKITILEIKTSRISDAGKLANVQDELRHLSAVRDRQITTSARLHELTNELREVNLALWQVEDDIRECERRKEFGSSFVSLARSVYRHNDRRAAIKRAINDLTGSRLIEEKSYAHYEAA
jgi:hypothetical protein